PRPSPPGRPRAPPTKPICWSFAWPLLVSSFEPDLDLLSLVALDRHDLGGGQLLQTVPEILGVDALVLELADRVVGQALEHHLREPDRQVDRDVPVLVGLLVDSHPDPRRGLAVRGLLG